MSNHNEISSFIWNVCDDVLRGLFKQHEYGDVILPFVVLRRLDCVLEGKKDDIIKVHQEYKDKFDDTSKIIHSKLDLKFSNYSRYDLRRLKDEPNKLSENFYDYLSSFSTNVQESFQNFYQTTILSEDTDPNLVYDILDKIRNHHLFTPQEIDDWNNIFFSENRDDSKLQPTLNVVLNRWSELSDEDRDSSRTQFSNYCKLYGYISMVHQFDNIELEKHYIFFEYLRKKFPVDGNERIDVSDLVDLESLNLDIKGKLNISLEDEDTFFDPNQYGDGKGKDEEEYDLLSEIINEVNEFYGKVPEGTEESSKKLLEGIINDEEFQSVITSNNTDSNKRDKLQKIYEDKNIKTLDTSTKLYEFFEKKEFKERMIRMFISRPELLNQLIG